MSWSLISVIKMVTIPDSFHPSAHFRDDRTMHGACPTVKGIKWVCFTGDILCSRKYSNAFVQETMYCNASVQESLLEVGVQQVGEGGDPCNTMQCNWIQFNTMQYNEILCNTLFRWVSNKWVREGAQIWKRPCTWNLKPFKQPETETEIEIWRGNQNLCHPIALATGLWFLLHISVLKRIKSFYRELSSVQLVGSFQILRVLGKYLTTLRTNTWSKTGQKFGQPPPHFGQCPKENIFAYRRSSLRAPSSIVAKIADIGLPGPPQYFFQKKNLEYSNYCTPQTN